LFDLRFLNLNLRINLSCATKNAGEHLSFPKKNRDRL
jgi:hypothetical protein